MKKVLFGFILGLLICSGIVYGVNIYNSNNIEYQPSDSSWGVSNVSDAINSLYNMNKLGDAVADNISEGKTAMIDGVLVTGNGADNKSFYDKGYADGAAAALDSSNLIYKYHSHSDGCNPTTSTCYHNWEKTGSKSVWKADDNGTGHTMTVSVYTATGTICGISSSTQDKLEAHSSWIENQGLQSSNWNHSVTTYGCGFEEGEIESVEIKLN